MEWSALRIEDKRRNGERELDGSEELESSGVHLFDAALQRPLPFSRSMFQPSLKP
jgi:hypothetical protein